ncbi:DegT/DnrJ/EryC1/StrS family aminotransferase [Rhizobium sp. P44RR-XXIV]|uniref:DegT/DnrJ/EryC1/StrS family aminotransferase n=1 Tax=Rhizobium sp. P44RR-XXIV TaxID=1921145 RepID=UPI000985323C|nr:DegT/DnrJ/EryC1/StrS family aminotransferase [Rhizobium sp. P44RR-XXIV]TIX89354.1 DegT/DnrJ/EryC1/StrS family aminotransferase [Rhizobium sp. P44RR-XXIV]
MHTSRRAPLYVTRPITPALDLVSRCNAAIFESGMYSNFGPMEQSLTSQFRERFDCDKVLLFNNGTIALLTALLSLPRKGGTFLTSPFTFPASVHCIKLAGYDVRFVDVDEKTLNIDPQKIEDACDDDTVGILAVHVYGNPCDISAIHDLCRRKALYEIYDAAHCFDVFDDGQAVYKSGLMSIASLHATKLMHTGEGGALFVSDGGIFERARSCMNFGIQGEDIIHGIGLNGKLSEINAAIGLAVLPQVTMEISKRKVIADRYTRLLSGLKGVDFPYFKDTTTRNYQYFPVIFDRSSGLDRDSIWSALRARNIFARKYFYPLLSDCFPYNAGGNERYYPIAVKAAQNVLCLPMHSGVSEGDVDEIVDIILQTLEGGKPWLSA